MKATVFPSEGSSGLVGYGDADPSNESLGARGAVMRMAEARAVNCAVPSLLSPFLLWFAFLAFASESDRRLLDLCQGALEEELDLLICRAMLPFASSSIPRFKAGSYSDKHGNPGFVHFQITKKLGLAGEIS